MLCPSCTNKIIDTLTFTESSIHPNHAYFSEYTNDIKALLSNIKFENNLFLAETVGDTLASLRFQEYPFFKTIDYWTSVPLHPQKLKKRGFNQATLLFEPFFKDTDIHYIDIVSRIKNTIPLFQMSKDERLNEIKESFCINEKYNKDDITNKTLVLCDDIYTTGTTINELKSVLEHLPFKEIKTITVTQVMDINAQ